MAATPRRHGDPMDLLSVLGWRVEWIADLCGDVLLLDDYGIALADDSLSRDVVTDRVLASLDARWGE